MGNYKQFFTHQDGIRDFGATELYNITYITIIMFIKQYIYKWFKIK